MHKPFWEKSYKVDDVATFGIEPNSTIQERWPMFEKNGTFLDVGCGEEEELHYATIGKIF